MARAEADALAHARATHTNTETCKWTEGGMPPRRARRFERDTAMLMMMCEEDMGPIFTAAFFMLCCLRCV